MSAPNFEEVRRDRRSQPEARDRASGAPQGQEYRAKVVAAKDGKLRYRLADGREFKSPSGAGSAVMGGVACNG